MRESLELCFPSDKSQNTGEKRSQREAVDVDCASITLWATVRTERGRAIKKLITEITSPVNMRENFSSKVN